MDHNFLRQSGSLAEGEIALHAQWFGQDYLDDFSALDTVGSVAVPEPASLALLGVLLFFPRRGRCRVFSDFAACGCAGARGPEGRG